MHWSSEYINKTNANSKFYQNQQFYLNMFCFIFLYHFLEYTHCVNISWAHYAVVRRKTSYDD